MFVEVFIIGDEFLIGYIVDSNFVFIVLKLIE